MSAAATASDPATAGRAASLLALVQKLITYGRGLADALRQNGAAALGSNAWRFGSIGIADILARITRGLELAAALEARIMRSAATLDAQPRPRTSAAPRAPRPATPRDAEPTLPSPAQIADALRHRPIGAVLADICRDLGILPSHPLWEELQLAIIRYSGNYARLMKDLLDRAFPLAAQAAARLSAPRRAAAPAITGPP